MNLSSVFTFIGKRYPKAISNEAVESLVTANKISFPDAAECAASIETANVTTEAAPIVNEANFKEMEGAVNEAVKRDFANAKFEAMLQGIKEDNTLLYKEFADIDNARNNVISEILKGETQFNSLLNQLKTTQGVDKNIIDNLIQVKVELTDIN
jgi:hypothetical protein